MATEEKVVRYTLTHKDVFAFNLRAIVRNRLIQLVIILTLAYIMYMGFHIPLPKDQPEPNLLTKIVAAFIVSTLALVAMCGIMFVFLVLLVWTNKFKNLLCEHELILSDAGMFSRSASSETMRKWTGLLKLKSTKKYLYLYVNETTAQIVPKRYFASPTEAQSFEQMIRERMKTG